MFDASRSQCRSDDRGQSAVLVLVVAATLGVAVVMALADVGGGVIDRTRAQTAADAAALGSLEGGRATAERLARRHSATIVSWSRDGRWRVRVTVRLGDATATAHASNRP